MREEEENERGEGGKEEIEREGVRGEGESEREEEENERGGKEEIEREGRDHGKVRRH